MELSFYYTQNGWVQTNRSWSFEIPVSEIPSFDALELITRSKWVEARKHVLKYYRTSILEAPDWSKLLYILESDYRSFQPFEFDSELPLDWCK